MLKGQTSLGIPSDDGKPTTKTTNLAKKQPVKYAFLYCNSPVTQQQYPEKLKRFFDFVEGLQEVGINASDIKSKEFLERLRKVRSIKDKAQREKEKHWINEQVMKYLDAQGQVFLDQTRQDPDWANEKIMEYVDYWRKRVFNKEISPSTLKTMLQPVKKFLDAFDDVSGIIKWNRIVRSMPKAKQFSRDRIPTVEELRKLIEYYDRRIKAVVFTMCSSGIRIGAWNYLKWKHIIPIKDPQTGEVKAAKIIIYAGENEEHFSFISPEAFQALREYMEYRQSYGEQITGESWLIRNYFKTADVKRKSPVGGNYGKVTDPKPIDQKSLNRLIVRAWMEQGIRGGLEDGKRRHEFKTAHSMRKYFKTKAEQVMNRLNVEVLMGHSIGLNSNYYRPTEQELLEDYQRAVPYLIITQDITSIKEQMQKELEQKQQQKDKQIESLEDKYRTALDVMELWVARINGLSEALEYQKAEIERLKSEKKKEEEEK